jgi:aspartate kinase
VDARIIEVRPFRVQDELERKKIVVVAGYQGVSYRREVTTLGRGGSDTTAVAMAAALEAEWCEICSDVDGVYTGDPRIVPLAKRIGVLSYEETQELAESGARVLNAQAVEFAKDKGIAIYARATAGPLPGQDPSQDGTVVRKSPPRPPGSVIGVASEEQVVMIQSRKVEELLTIMDEFGCPGKQLRVTSLGTPQDGLTLVISKENLHQISNLRAKLGTLGSDLTWNDELGAVSVVGASINASHEKVRQGSEALRSAQIPPFGLATSSFRITWMVRRNQVNESVRLLHALFIESKKRLVP